MLPDEGTSGVSDASAPEPVAPQFKFERYLVRRVSYEETERLPVEPGEKRPKNKVAKFDISASIRMNQEQLFAEVSLDVHVTPDAKWNPCKIHVVVTGHFRAINVPLEVFDQFCRAGVPPILFPYVREIVHKLTIDSVGGVVRLQPVNLSDMAAQAQWKVAAESGADSAAKPSNAP